MNRKVLILGANGRFGRHAVTAFAAAGWHVRRFDRSRDSLPEAAEDMAVIVNGWNPPYPRWQADLPGQTQQVIAAAEQSGALLIQLANIYPYGTDAPERLAPDVPHSAQNPLGRLRTDMEAAMRASRARVLVLRAGDFIDDRASGNWFDHVLIGKLAKGKLVYPGPTDVPHAWAWLPDLARAAVSLAEQGTVPRYREICFPGYTLTGDELLAVLERVTGQSLRLRRMSWLPIRALALVWPMGRNLVEMSYLWRKPHYIDEASLREALPGFQVTPVDKAIASAVHHEVYPDESVARGHPRHVQRSTV